MGFPSSLTQSAVLLVSLMISSDAAFLSVARCAADDAVSLGAVLHLDHQPVHVRSKPVIERLPVKVIEPVDLRLSNKGSVFVGDRSARCVFRVDGLAGASVVVDDLENIQRIQLDDDDSLFVLSSSGGEAAIHQITSTGHHVVLEKFAFPASAFVRDAAGEFVIAVKDSGQLMRVSTDSTAAPLSELSHTVADLTLNPGGQLEALLVTGHVVRVAPDGQARISGFAPPGSTRLTSLEDGALLALCHTPLTRSQVVYVSREPVPPEKFSTAATVPAGTHAVGFDVLGNMCLANADLRAVTKVTSQFLIPCPHCGRETRLILSTESAADTEDSTRGF